MRRRLLFWVQHLLGTGHLRRVLAIAEACARRGQDVLVATGGPPGPWAAPKGVRLLQLPPLQASDSSFSSLVDPQGRVADEAYRRQRVERLRAATAEHRPHAVVTEMFPFGRNAFREEILALIEAARAARPGVRIACSVRDVLVSKSDPARYRHMADLCLAHFDRVLVHGDPALIPFSASFPLTDRLGPRLVHTGYVLAAPPVPPAAGRAGVVVSAGGGRVGRRLLEAAIAARPLSRRAGEPWRIVTGAGLPPHEAAALRAKAGPGLEIDRYRDDLPALIAAAALSISQAGYNTAAEVIAAGTPAILVPFAEAGEDEQLRRAECLAAAGLALLVPGDPPMAEALAAAIDRAAERTWPAVVVRLDGADRAAILLGELAADAGAA